MQGIDNGLGGKLLLATPSIGDPRFRHAVIFIVTHDKNGALGLMVNFPVINLTFAELLQQTKIPLPDRSLGQIRMLSGGPVEAGHGFLLHTSDYARPETIIVTPQFHVTATIEALSDVANGCGPRESLFVLGYSGWGAGQIEQEIADNAWLVVDADHDLLFNTESEDCWDRAYGRLGVNPTLLSSQSGRA